MQKSIIIIFLIFLCACDNQIYYKTASKVDDNIYTYLSFKVQGDKILNLKETIKLNKSEFSKDDLKENLLLYEYDEDELYHYLICDYGEFEQTDTYLSFKKTKYEFTKLGYDFGY